MAEQIRDTPQRKYEWLSISETHHQVGLYGLASKIANM